MDEKLIKKDKPDYKETKCEDGKSEKRIKRKGSNK